MSDSPTDPRYGRAGMARNTAIVMGMTVLSGLLGLLRESIIASRFGTGDDLAAYKLAYGIPDLIYVVIIGGALGTALIPVFTAIFSALLISETFTATKIAGMAIVIVGVLVTQVKKNPNSKFQIPKYHEPRPNT